MMRNRISKLPNGDFRVEPDTTIYGIRKMLRPKHRDYWDKPIRRNRKEQLTLEEIEYRHERNRMNADWDGLTHSPDRLDPDVAILDDIILSAHHRIKMYETLDKGLWHSIFGTNNKDEIVRERELIREYTQMREEMISWKKRVGE